MSLREAPTINLELHPKQSTALSSAATEALFGGAAGGGKSYLMRCAAIIWCASIPGLQVYLFRRLFPDLIKNHMEGPKGFRLLLAPWVAAGYVTIVEEEIRFWNGSRIFLCHCKDEKDRFKYQGAEIHVLLIDELTHFTEIIYRFLRTRVRAVGLNLPEQFRGRFPRILCGSNPGNVGHAWVKRAFVEAGAFLLRRMDDNEGGMLRQFIPSRLDDNPSMQEDDPSYRARLRGAGSTALVKALEEGDWNVIEGAFFDGWSTEKHVVTPFVIPEHWARIRSFDWGFGAPFSVGWWAVASEPVRLDDTGLRAGSGIGLQSPQPPRAIPRGCLVRYREWYGASEPNVGLRLEAEQIAAGILAREKGESMANAVADTQIFAQDGKAYGYTGPTIGERMAKAGCPFHPADKSRKQGWDQLRQRLRGDLDGNPMMVVFDTCIDTIRTLPVMQHDLLDPEDLDTESEDHAVDEIRYACQSRPWIRPAPQPDRPLVDTRLPTLRELVRVTERTRGRQGQRI